MLSSRERGDVDEVEVALHKSIDPDQYKEVQDEERDGGEREGEQQDAFAIHVVSPWRW